MCSFVRSTGKHIYFHYKKLNLTLGQRKLSICIASSELYPIHTTYFIVQPSHFENVIMNEVNGNEAVATHFPRMYYLSSHFSIGASLC